jgi:protein TonB
LSRAALVAIAAILFHAIAIGFIALASSIARGVGDDRSANIEVAVVDRPPPPPKVEVKPEPKPEPEKPKEPEKKQAVKPPPPKDPIDKPKEEPKPEEKPKEPVRRIIGLNLESTTSGGSGPSFATGNTRMGETEKKAAMPAEVAPIPANVDEKPVQGANKAATRIPIAGSKIVAPSRKKAIIPNYPERARQAGIEGDVVVRVTIDARGKPTAVAVVKAADLDELNEAAKEAALREEFSPATRDGVPIEYTLTYTYFFRLNG